MGRWQKVTIHTMMGNIPRELLEYDLRRIVGKRNWDATVDLLGDLGFVGDDGSVQYRKLPKPLQGKVKDYIREHPRSRLAKCFVREGGGDITFKPREPQRHR